MSDLDDAFPSRFLKADDVLAHGDYWELTMTDVNKERIGKDLERKPIVSFRETDKELVLNKTNGYAIAGLIGSENFADWIGKKIRLHAPTVEYKGESAPGIRVLTQ